MYTGTLSLVQKKTMQCARDPAVNAQLCDYTGKDILSHKTYQLLLVFLLKKQDGEKASCVSQVENMA